MRQRDLHNWMWADALTLLDEAERLRRQFFRLRRGASGSTAARPDVPAWEPPVDLIETAEELWLIVALPGVAARDVAVTVSPGAVLVSAVRRFSATRPGTRIHRVEIPYGRFERHIPLPAGLLELTERSLRDGCLTLAFRRKEGETE